MRFGIFLPLFAAALASAQTITTFAGMGSPGFFGDGGPANQALINDVVGLAADANGNIYMADQNNNRIRKVDVHGVITTFAGSQGAGFMGDTGPATSALLNGPTGVCVAPSGDVYINDQSNHRVRKVAAATGIITTVAGSGSTVPSGDSGLATAAGMQIPIRCAVDSSGNLYIVDQGAAANVVYKVDLNGMISRVAGTYGGTGFSGDNGPATQATMFNLTAISIDPSGNLYLTDQGDQRIRRVDTNGMITTVAGNGHATFGGDGLPATSASLNYPGETVIDSAGNLFIVDTVNQVVREVTAGIITTVAGMPGSIGSGGDGGPPLRAQFNYPFPITLDPAGNLYIGDTGDNRVREVTSVATPPAQCTYALNIGGQSFPAAGGGGSITITAPQGCAWSLANGPNWVTGSTPGSGNGTLTYQVLTNIGADRSATLTVAGISFTIDQEAASITGLTYIGSMPHIAAQENWTTTFTLVNKGATPATARLNFFNDPTGLLTLPLTFPQQPSATGPLLASTIDNAIAANASLIVESAGPQTPPVDIGSAQLSASGNVDGFAIFHLIPGAQEAVVPMETRSANSYILAFDNTNGVVLGVAVANVSAQAGTVGVILRNDAGAQIGTGSIAMQPNGHKSFVLSDPTTGFPVTANIRGTIEFDTPPGGQISVLGIRTTPLGNSNTLTTIPALANVGTTGGSIAHIATGNGWQTTFVLVNTGTTAASVNLNFYADVTGTPQSLPISFPQTSSTVSNASSVMQTLAAGASLYVQSDAPASDPMPTEGSAQLTTNGNVSGFVIFRYNPNGQEAVVPLESRVANGFLVAFDNTGGTATGIAVNSVSAASVNVPVIVRDDAGNQLTTDTLSLNANGHLAFTLGSSQSGYKFPQTANIRGTIEFDTPVGAQIGALGIRIPIAHTFTTLPALVK
jgi:hypothetical protein